MDQKNRPIPDADAGKGIAKKPSRTGAPTTCAAKLPIHRMVQVKGIKIDLNSVNFDRAD